MDKKGDLVRRYNRHVTFVYDKPFIPADESTFYYKMIHAYGGDVNELYQFPDIQEAELYRNDIVFAIKVIVTFQNASPATGFGRIKLWD